MPFRHAHPLVVFGVDGDKLSIVLDVGDGGPEQVHLGHKSRLIVDSPDISHFYERHLGFRFLFGAKDDFVDHVLGDWQEA